MIVVVIFIQNISCDPAWVRVGSNRPPLEAFRPSRLTKRWMFMSVINFAAPGDVGPGAKSP